MRYSRLAKFISVFVFALCLCIAEARADVYILGGGGGGGGGSGASAGGYGGGGAGGYIGITDYHHPADASYPFWPIYRGGDGEDVGYVPPGPGGANSNGAHSGQSGGAGSGPGTTSGFAGESGYDISGTYYGGEGGRGGDAHADDSPMALYFNEGDRIYVLSGSGGTSSNNADGGWGGAASLVWATSGMHTVDRLHVMVGSHGQGLGGLEGGRPGSAVFEMLNGSLTLSGNQVQITAGYAEARAEMLSMRVINGGIISINCGANSDDVSLSHATLKLNAAGAALITNGALAVRTICQSDGRFIAENAESIRFTGAGQGIEVTNYSWNTFLGVNNPAKALFYTPKAVVSVDNANIAVVSATTPDNPYSSAVFIAKEVYVGGTGANGNISVTGGVGSARMEISGGRVSAAWSKSQRGIRAISPPTTTVRPMIAATAVVPVW